MTDVKEKEAAEREEIGELANNSSTTSINDDEVTTKAKENEDSTTAIVSVTDAEIVGDQQVDDAPPPDPSQKLANGVDVVSDKADENTALPDEPSSASLPLPLSKLSVDKIDFIRGPHNRVKLYVLCNQRVWDDRGTGHVACLPASDGSDAMSIVVRLEASGYDPHNSENKVLESRILLDTIYQKQQGTLIVWSESETCDLALSFQEKAGCAEIWDKICRIQGKDPDAEEDNECDEQEPSDSSTSGISAGVCASTVTLPPCDLAHLPELKSALSDGVFLSTQREKLANAVLQNEYVPKLCDLFQICEDLDNRERLRHLYCIAKSLFLLNSNSLLTELLDEKYFKDIVGMLEYDPALPEPKKHREFLWEKSKFREILPIKSADLKSKIHQTFRVQYVLDLCLPAPSLFEENLLTVLSSHLFFNRAEIVGNLLNDKDLMKQLFEELRDPKISAIRQRDLTNFLKEFCTFAHSLQPNGPQGREQFFKMLMANDVLSTIDPCISSPLNTTREATVELLTMIVDFEPKAVREFFVNQFHKIPPSRNDDLLINKLIKHMLSDRDPEQTAATQMSNALRVLLDPENIVTKVEKAEFLPLFYKRAMHSLCQPIMDNAKDGTPIRDDYYTANKLALLIDLFCFFVDHHNYSMRAYTTQKDLLRSVLVYLKSRHHFLALCALRMCRRILSLNDPTYFKYMLEKGIIKQIVDCFVANGPRYNLLNSALIEFFEFIRMEDIRSLMEYVVENHWDVFGSVDYVRTFSAMKIRYDQIEASRVMSLRSSLSRDENGSNGSVTPTRGAGSDHDETILLSPAGGNAAAQWKKEQEYDNDELFFGKDDNESWGGKSDDKNDSDGSVNVENAPQRKSGIEPLFLSVNRKRKASDDDGVASIFGGNASPSISNTSQNRPPKIVICMNANGNGNSSSRMPVEKRVPENTSPVSPPSSASSSSSSSSASSASSENASSGGSWKSINNQGGAGDGDSESTVSSSSNSPPKTASPTSTTNTVSPEKADREVLADSRVEDGSGSQFISSLTSTSPAADSSKKDASTIDKSVNNKNPIILKKGLSGLVDYDESDEDSE